MTFKHTKFEDSTTMRSLVKVAQEKGWVKEEPLQKTAAPKLDLKPTDNLTQNLVKLCTGLRASGFEKQAEELESKFVQYKKANSHYEVTNEKGEDLIHDAHPEESHKMEGIDSDEATFEGILDRHVKMMQAVDEKPTGKLSDASSILDAVKMVLSQAKVAVAAPTLDELYDQANTAFQKFKQIYASIALQTGEDASLNRDYFNSIQSEIDGRKAYSSQNLGDNLIDAVDSFKDDKEPGFFSGSDEKQKWQDTLLPMFGIATRYAQQFQAIIGQIRKLETAAKTQQVAKQYDPDAPAEVAPKAPPPASPQVQRLNALLSKLNGYKLIGSVARSQTASKWIADEIGEVSQLLANVQRPEAVSVMPALEKEIAEKEGEVNQFAQSWVGA